MAVFLVLSTAACGTAVAPIDAAAPDTGVDASITCDPLLRPTGRETVAGDLGRVAAPIAIEDFCVAYAQALCTAPPGCGCGDAPLNCIHYANARCGDVGGALSPEMRASIDAGDALYDASAAGRAIQAIVDASTDCARAPASIDLDFLIAVTSAVHGDLAPGAACDPSAPFECVAGSWCRDSGDFVHLCSDAHPICAAFGLCEGTSVHAPRLVCDGDPCDRGAPPGSVCGAGSTSDCATVCRGDATRLVCSCPVADGDACELDADCQSGDCIAGACGTSAARLEDPCREGQACLEGTCAGGMCRSWQCGGGWY